MLCKLVGVLLEGLYFFLPICTPFGLPLEAGERRERLMARRMNIPSFRHVKITYKTTSDSVLSILLLEAKFESG